MSWDVIVVGGGPAGATVASILLTYRPQTRVLVLERDQFPRPHVGETLVTEINRVLHEMGAYDKVDQAGFVRKWGVTFQWGAEKKPWDLIFGQVKDYEAKVGDLGPVQTMHTWHIRRAEYDQILLDHTAELGATVRQTTGVRRAVREGDRVVGVETLEGEVLRARFVVDATGQGGFEGSSTDREPDPRLRNVACTGYFRRFELHDEWNGSLQESRAFICAHPYGWSWMFPVEDDLVSVGTVTMLETWKALEDKDPERFLLASIDSSPEMRALLQQAELTPLQPGMPRVQRLTDFSYVSRQIAQPGMIRVGDAAGFVDPILAVGCFLGQTLGRIGAYALLSCLDDERADEARLFEAYADHVRDTLGAYRELTYFFYRFNERTDAWWRKARELTADAGLPVAASDHQAFYAFATGFAARRSVFREPTIVFDEPFFVDAYRHLVDADGLGEVATAELAGADVLTLRGSVQTKASAVPVEGKGKMASSIRAEVIVEGDEGPAHTRRMHVPPSVAPVFQFVDGARTVDEIGHALADLIGVPDKHRAKVGEYARSVLLGLVERGLATRRAEQADRTAV